MKIDESRCHMARAEVESSARHVRWTSASEQPGRYAGRRQMFTGRVTGEPAYRHTRIALSWFWEDFLSGYFFLAVWSGMEINYFLERQQNRTSRYRRGAIGVWANR